MRLPFLNELATDWMAIGFLGGVVPVLLFAKFNYWCARSARRQCKGATEQAAAALWAAQMAKERAESAMQSLEEMMHWAEIAQNLRRETAIESLELFARTSRSWIVGLLKGYESGEVKILPRRFDEVMAFLIFQMPSMEDEIQLFQRKAVATENILKAFMEKPLSVRSVAPRIAINLGHQLEQVAVGAESLAESIKSYWANSPKNPAYAIGYQSGDKQPIGSSPPSSGMDSQTFNGNNIS
jgi:hypothetical protein